MSGVHVRVRMDLYSSSSGGGGMPQVKTATVANGSSVYTAPPPPHATPTAATAAAFVDQSELSNQSLARATDVTTYNSDILTSSAWSAVIHHPAEDSEPDELPSTVDMDAIKEPPTPLPAPCTPGGTTMHSHNEDESDDEDDEDDDSDSDSEDGDSDSETGNESNTESEEGSRSGGGGTWSESESESEAESEASGGGTPALALNKRRPQRKSANSSSSHSSLSESSDGGEGDGGGGGEKKKCASREVAAYDQSGEHYYRSRQPDPANPMKVKISALKLTKHKPSKITTASDDDDDDYNSSDRMDSSADEKRKDGEEDEEGEEEDDEEEQGKEINTSKKSYINSSEKPSSIKKPSKIGLKETSAIEKNCDKYSSRSNSSLQSDRESLRSAAAAFHRRTGTSRKSNSYYDGNSDTGRTITSRNSDSNKTTSASRTVINRDSKLEDSRDSSYLSGNINLSRTVSHRESPNKLEDSRTPNSGKTSNSDLSRTGASRTVTHRDSKLEDSRTPNSGKASNSDLSRTGSSRTVTHRDSLNKLDDSRISNNNRKSDSSRTGASRTVTNRDSPSKLEDSRISNGNRNSDLSRTVKNQRDSKMDADSRNSNSDLGRTSRGSLRDLGSKLDDTRALNSDPGRRIADEKLADKVSVAKGGRNGSEIVTPLKSNAVVNQSPSKLSRKGLPSSDVSRNVSRSSSSPKTVANSGSLSKSVGNSGSRSRDKFVSGMGPQPPSSHHQPPSCHLQVAGASSIRLRSSRKKPADVVASHVAPPATATAAPKQRTAAFEGTGSEGSSSDEDGDDEEEEDDEDEEEEKDEITQLAQQLVRPSSTLPISEHLQVINQEDLAAILPDVVGVGGGPFDGFEDAQAGGTSGAPSVPGAATSRKGVGVEGAATGGIEGGTESSSDMEMLPDVTDVINRIDSMTHDDSEGPDAVSEDEDDDEEDDEDANSGTDEVGYSSNLLQRFNQQTEQICAGSSNAATGCRNRPSQPPPPTLQSTARTMQLGNSSSRRRRGRPPKPTAASSNSLHKQHQQQHQVCMHVPELEAYCSASNVSPDSGIQSVAGSPSPAHRHSSCSSPPAPQPSAPPPQPHSPTISGMPTSRVSNSPQHRKPAGKSDGASRQFGQMPDAITKDAKLTKLYTTSDELHVGEGGKRGPGRPSKSSRSSSRKKKQSRQPRNEEQCLPDDLLKVPPFFKVKSSPSSVVKNDHEDLPRLHGMMVLGKRGPGRPKKTPPTLEPNLPLGGEQTTQRTKKDHHHHHHHHHKHHHHHHNQLQHSNSNNSLLNEICEQVSKRLDIAAVDEKQSTIALEPPMKFGNNGELKEKSKSHHHHHHKHKHHHGEHLTSKLLPLKLELQQQLKTVPLKVKPTFVASNGRKNAVKTFAVKHHKHKKRRKKASRRRSVEVKAIKLDPSFLTDLDQLVDVFEKLCHIRPMDVKKSPIVNSCEDVPVLLPEKTKLVDTGVKSSPTSNGTAVVTGKSSKSKKRKATAEKTASSGREKDQQSHHEIVDSKEKVVFDLPSAPSVPAATVVVKRRLKKTAVETPKNRDKPEANNEQRLPLKKRHYHMSSTPTSTATHSSGSVSSESSPDSSVSDETGNSSKSSSAASSDTKSSGGLKSSETVVGKSLKSSETVVGKSLKSGVAASQMEKVVEKSSIKGEKVLGAKSVGASNVAKTSSAPAKQDGKCALLSSSSCSSQTLESSSTMTSSTVVSSEVAAAATLISSSAKVGDHRDSIDEAIEACINKYADGDNVAKAAAGGSVIVTPKKRHRLEVDDKKEKGAGVQVRSAAKPLTPTTVHTSQGSPSQTTNKRVSSRSLSATSHQSCSVTVTPTTSAVTVPGKRTSSRIAAPVTVTSSVTSSSQNHCVTTKRVSARSSSVVESGSSSVVESGSSSNVVGTPATSTTNVVPSKRSHLRSSSSTTTNTMTTTCAATTTTVSTTSGCTMLSAAKSESRRNSLRTSLSKRGSIAFKVSVDATETSVLTSKLDKTLKIIVSDCDSVNTRSSTSTIKGNLLSTVDEPPLITPIPDIPVQKSPRMRSTHTKPPAGVFEPSTKIDDIVNLPKIPSPPPVKSVRTTGSAVNHVLNKLTERLKGLEKSVVDECIKTEEKTDDSDETSMSRSLRTKRAQDDCADDPCKSRSSSSGSNNNKKRKLIKDVRVHVTKLLPSDLVVTKLVENPVVLKQKVKRRKAINRTGFPVKKKKKKKVVVESSVSDSPLPPPILEDQTKLVLVDDERFVDATPALSPMTVVESGTKTAKECEHLNAEIEEEDQPLIVKRPARESARQKNNNNNNNAVAPDIKGVIQELKKQKDSVMAAKKRRKEKEEEGEKEEKGEVEEKRRTRREREGVDEEEKGDVEEKRKMRKDDGVKVEQKEEVQEKRRTRKEGVEEEQKEDEDVKRKLKKDEDIVMNRRPIRKVVVAAQQKNSEEKRKEDECKEETEMKENVEESSKKRQTKCVMEEKRSDVKKVERKSLKDITCDRKQKVKKEVVGDDGEGEVDEGEEEEDKKIVKAKQDVKGTKLKEESVMEAGVEKKKKPTKETETEIDDNDVLDKVKEGEEEEEEEDKKKTDDDDGRKEKRARVEVMSNSLGKIRNKSQRHRRDRRTEASKRRKRKRNGLLLKKKHHKRGKEGEEEELKGRLRAKRMRKTKEEVEQPEEDDSDDDTVDPSPQPTMPTSSRKKVSIPRWRKRYLAAGLFSDLYKTNEGDEVRRPSVDVSSWRIYRPEEHRWGLMPAPHYCAKWVRQRRVHFQLPHDLWWLHKNSRLPGRDVVPSWNHKKIRTNVYYDVKPSYMYEAQACNCNIPSCCNQTTALASTELVSMKQAAAATKEVSVKPTSTATKEISVKPAGCGEDCINRLIYTECSPRLCPCRELCSNQRIQRHEWAPGLVKFMTANKGWGVKTKHAIRTGEFILEYVGEVVSEREFKNRMASRYHSDTHHYCLNLDGGLVIDGHRMGGDGRFVNHSCEPNCEMQKWSVNGLFRMALFALRDIEPHEELTYDYNFALFNPAEGQPCRCGSSNCRGVIGGKYQRVSVIKESQESGAAKSRKKSRKGQVDPKQSKNNGANKAIVGSTAKETVNKETQASSSGGQVGSTGMTTIRANQLLPPKPLTTHQQQLVKSSRVFLLRNFEKVKQRREKLKQQHSSSTAITGSAATSTTTTSTSAPAAQDGGAAQLSDAATAQQSAGVFLSQLNALSTPRNVRTRRLAQAQDDPQVTRTARLAHILKQLLAAVVSAKHDNGELVASSSLVCVPSKRRQPDYHERIQQPIDLQTIDANLKAGHYRTLLQFDADMLRVFANCQRFHGRTSPMGTAAAQLRRLYTLAKRDALPQIEAVLGEPAPPSFVDENKDPGAEEEDVIRCVCGMYRDEGLMIQCERCLVWQHCDCVKADAGVEHYLCERCHLRPIDLEIKYDTNPDYATEGQTHYMTLLRGELQVRQGDTVYVLRDIPNEETGSSTTPPSKHNYKTIKVINYNDCDIFRIERLWKDEKGDRFVFGHHYLRPHETYHEPTRKFFPNEVMRVPLYEVVPIELVMGHCYVLDPNTYCKGRPLDADMRHVYICEYRVDKCARLFAKLARPKQPTICTKSYAFEKYPERLKISRTYTPHGPPPSTSTTTTTTTTTTKTASTACSGGHAVSRSRGGRTSTAHDEPPQPPPQRDAVVTTTNAATNTTTNAAVNIHQLPTAKRAHQKQRLNGILLRLLARVPSKQVLDISYLLEPGRRNRKRPALLSP